jgi:hypothetical protein
MSKNRIRNKETNSWLNKITDFDFSITRENIPRFIPFVLFISFLILMYIANKYYAEEAILEQSKLKNELKDLRAETLTIEAELADKTKRSEIANITKDMGLVELEDAAKKIVVKKDEY